MKLRIFAAPLLALSFTFVNPCSQQGKPKHDNAPDDTIHEVSVIHPEFSMTPQSYAVDGTFDASEVHLITAGAPGYIEQIYVNEGDTVAQNDPIVSLSNTELTDKIDVRKAKIKELNARLKEAQAKLQAVGGEDTPAHMDDTAFLDDEPLDEPVQTQFGDASQAKTKPQTQKALVEVITANIELITKEVEILEKKLLSLSQNSPVGGVLTRRFVTEGNHIKDQDRLVEISQTNPMSVTFFLPDEVASFVDKNSKVKVSPKDAPDVVGTGTVTFISPQIDPDSGKIEVRAHVSNDTGAIKGGQKAVVNVETRKMNNTIVLPKKALFYEDDKTYVYIVFREQAKLVPVRTGDEDGNGGVQVFGDLRVDDPIIIDRPMELQNNSYVKVLHDEK